MPESPSPSELQPIKANRWQFSLQSLFLLIVGISFWMAMSSWSLRYSSVLLIWIFYFCFLFPFRNQEKKQFTIMEWIPIVATVVVLFLLLAFPPPNRLQQQPGTVRVLVLDAKTQLPVEDAWVFLYPRICPKLGVRSRTKPTGIAEITATFPAVEQDAGWGRKRYTLDFQGTQLEILSRAYGMHYVQWDEVSDELTRDSNAPPGAPVVIRLQLARQLPLQFEMQFD